MSFWLDFFIMGYSLYVNYGSGFSGDKVGFNLSVVNREMSL